MKHDIGLTWAKTVVVIGQIGAVQGAINTLMLVGIFYTTTLRPALDIPLWLYLLVVLLSGSVLIGFILTIGISGYYRFFNQQSALGEAHRDILALRKDQESILKAIAELQKALEKELVK